MKPSANPKRTLIESLQVGLAWDSQIKEWAERELPNGEVVGRVKNAQTVNYKTLKPVKDGLFCEKIFGPTKDFECACGFKQTRGGFCPQCNVEFTRSEVRRYRLGYFQLPSAVTHVWYLRGRPSYISYLLGIKIKKALALTYGAASLLVNSQNEKVVFQEESESLTFSFTTQTLYAVGECKGKTVPRSQIRRYNPNHFLFDKKRAKLIKNFLDTFIYTSRAKGLSSGFASHSDCKNAFGVFAEQKQDKQSFYSSKKPTLPGDQFNEKEATQKTDLQSFYKEDLKTSFLSAKAHDSSKNSYITKPFFFSSTIRGGWQPLIVVNLQYKLPVHLSYKKTHFQYYKFKKYLKFSQNLGFYTPSIFAKEKEGIEDVYKNTFFAKQNQVKNSSLIKTNQSGETFDLPDVNNLLNMKHGDKGTLAKGHENKTKFFFEKFILSNKKKKVQRFLVGIDKNKELNVSTLIFYPIKKEIRKVEEKKRLIRSSPELAKNLYQELDFKFKSLNSVEKTTKQVEFSSLSENLQEKFKNTKPVFEHSVSQNGKPSERNQFFTFNKEELTRFRSRFHFIGQPCQLKKKSRFLVHTASSFSQTRNQIFKILKKEKYINSVDFSKKLSYYGENLKEKYRIFNNNIKKQYHQNHLLPYLFCLSCQSKNYQYLQTYSNFFIPTFHNSEKTLLISSYKNQIRKNQFLNLYDSYLKNKLTISTLFSCFDNSSTIDLKHLINVLPSIDFFAEKNEIESPEKLDQENLFQKVGDSEFTENNENHSKGETFGKEDTLKLEEILQLQNSNLLTNQSRTSDGFATITIGHDEIGSILGEIPLVLDLYQNKPEYAKKTSQFFQQKKDVLFSKSSLFWKLKKKSKLLQDKNLENHYFVEQNTTGQNLQNKLSQTKSKAVDFVQQNKKKRKGLFSQNSKLQERFLPKILLKLNKDSPLFLQNININFLFNSSRNNSFFRGLLIKNLFFIEVKSQFLKNNTFSEQKLRETYQSLPSFYQAKREFSLPSTFLFDKNGSISASEKSFFDEKAKRSQKINLFESFAEQNFPPEWKSRQQIKRIFKTANILRNFEKITLSPIPLSQWSNLSKKLNKKDSFFSIYEISVQQALGYTCGEAILKILSPIDCYQLESGLKVVLWQINERISEVEDQGFLLKSDIILLNSLRTKKSRTLRRLKIAKILRKTKVLPKQMVFSLLPVLPPSLRPIIQLDENIVAVSDCSQIYQKIVQRSNRLSKRMSKYLSYDHCLRLKVLLQQAVDGLIENGKGGSKPLCDNNGRPLKSLSDGLKGKKGRFRQDLLGRRVDYSGRSVIVVGPALKLHQCGLPREMAIELFQPFLIRQLFAKKIVFNIAVAKNYIKKETPIVLEILKQLLRSHPVLLNRAPTLHRLGVQAFQPKLVSGRAILLHPLVCSAFNADFDGDQMAVHIPLSSKARGEAWKILWSRNNILSPATGQPILVPSQDMVLGCYYLTTKKTNLLTKNLFETEKKNIKKQSLTSSDRPSFHQSKIDNQVNQNLQNQFNPNQSDFFSSKMDFGKKQLDTETCISPRKNSENPMDQRSIMAKPPMRTDKWARLFFNNSYQVLKDLQQKRLKLHDSIWLKMDRDVEIHKEEQKPLEARINCCGNFTKIYPGYLRRFYKKEGLFFHENDNKVKKSEDFYVRTTCGRVMLNQTISPILHQPF